MSQGNHYTYIGPNLHDQTHTPDISSVKGAHSAEGMLA